RCTSRCANRTTDRPRGWLDSHPGWRWLVTGSHVVCQSCGRGWSFARPRTVYERQALESCPCPRCSAYTLTCHNRPRSAAAGGRAVRVTEDFLAGLLEGLDGEVGDAAADVAYRCGYQWGVEDLQSFTARAREQFETDVEKLPLGVALESWWAPFAAAGWGRWQYDFVQSKKGVILADLRGSAVAAAVGPVGRPVCHLYAGLFAACF